MPNIGLSGLQMYMAYSKLFREGLHYRRSKKEHFG
jgi:hypothetical protein